MLLSLALFTAGLSLSATDASVEIPVTGPAAWKQSLDERVKAVLPITDDNADLVALAYARLRELENLAANPVDADRVAYQTVTCSLWVESALAQLKALELRRAQRAEGQKYFAAMADLAEVQEDLVKLERGYSTSLKTNLKDVTADLELQKRKAQEARDDAEKRFGELNSALIQVKKDARGTIISMSDILFDIGKATLTQELKTSLAKIAGILTVYKDAGVIVEGHTDNQGAADFNQKLSEKRASNVRDFFIQPGGIDSTRLSAVGYGFSKPVADNATKEGRQKNRRVDLVISEKKSAP